MVETAGKFEPNEDVTAKTSHIWPPLVERVARAMADSQGVPSDSHLIPDFRDMARAAIEATIKHAMSECCGEVDCDGICCAPACRAGTTAKFLHAALEGGE